MSGQSIYDKSFWSSKKFTLDDFVIEKTIGTGSYGKVWQAKEITTGSYVAIKMVRGELRSRAKTDMNLFFEAIFHRRVSHPNIVKRFTTLKNRETRDIFYVMEYAENGSLFDVLRKQKNKRFDERTSAKFLVQVASALEACHKYGNLHGDVKPENILVDEKFDCKLTDFGFTWPRHSSEKRGYCGTTEYLAPEVLRGEKYNKEIDYWSLGVLLFEMLAGRSPFKSMKLKTTRDKIEKAQFNFHKSIGPEARDLISKLLVVNPKDRLDCKGVLEHPWVKRWYSVESSDEEEEE